MDRPVTSKSRGICRYYNTPRGCYAGDDCKFLHGPEEKLTPYDKSKVCRYYIKGHCTRGARCWFRHELVKVPLDEELKNFDENMCNICLEKPQTYGLLTGCGHVFCLQCIRQWREPQGKSSDMVMSGVIKRCPLCRSPSRFITPSMHFFPQDHPRKQEMIDSYKNSMARVPCKSPCCPFGLDCFYQHLNPDGTLHVFQYGAGHFMKVWFRQFFGAASDTDLTDRLRLLQSILGDPTNNLHITLNFVRRHLPAIWNGMDAEFGSATDTPISQSFELLAESIAAERSLEDTISRILPVTHASLTDEGSPHPPVETPVIVPMASIPPRARSASPVMEPSTTPPVPFRPSSSAEVSGPLPHSFLPWAMPRTPSPRPPSIPPASMTSTVQQSNTSRFSTVLNSRSRETMVIDISDEDEEDEAEEDCLSCSPSIGNDNDNDNDAHSLSTSTLSDRPGGNGSLPVSSEAAEAPTSSTGEQTVPSSRPQCEHDADPPFVTDGRGRVVWSRTARGPSHNQAQVDARERHRSNPTIKARRQTSETGAFATDGRSRVVWTGQEGSEVTGRISGTETETDAE
ncbi:uncharacterized protein EDB91DRAFT_1118274 [Suillus paluster]|uniref:uncharacterized protein n=1 Tax=Suillus paluster TaxID=48578 RepID=UPI001B85CC0D|nr:uncharacterized protein EDB91DRAFT_1118274 [Suillus paluster]KAG1746670.1 hypothetical protein EDB91DRAFT_1118274 [Suillus paluster]